MRVEANPKIARAQLIAVNVFSLIVGVTAYFVAGHFLIPFGASLLVLNGFWYFSEHVRKRVVALELDEPGNRLILSYNKARYNRTFSLDGLNMEFKGENDHNANRVIVLAIYQNGEQQVRFKIMGKGFDPETLLDIVNRVDYLWKVATGEIRSAPQSDAP